MAEGWMRTLSQYVNQHNQDEIDFGSRVEEGIVTDLEYLLRLGERKRRLADWYAERKAVPLRCETRAKLLREIEHREGEVEVELQLLRKTDYERRGVPHREEVIHKQRLTLQHEDGDWTVARVLEPISERSAPRKSEGAAESAKSGAGSKPYLNRELLKSGFRSTPYRRQDAVLYADRWWDDFNPQFAAFEVDCTNYISQCLFAGGAPINYTGKRDSGWWYKGYVGGKEAWSYSWAVSNALERYLSSGSSVAEPVNRAEQLELGDVIVYDWDGNGAFQHSTIVTAYDADGMPLVNAHTVPSKHRYWDYRDSYAWSDNTVYHFFRIADRF